MLPGPSRVLRELLESLPVDAHPRPVVELIEDVIVRNRWASRLEAREVAERLAPAVLQKLRIHNEDACKAGRPIRLTVNSSSAYMVQGAAFIEGADPPRIQELKRRYLHVDEYKRALDGLTPEEFELLCKRILELLGVSDARLTPYRADCGIDFYGRLELGTRVFPNDLYPTLQRQLAVWLVGQAKHVKGSAVSTPHLRELVGSVTLAKWRAFPKRGLEAFHELNLRACDPIFYLFFTTGHISRDGWELLQKSGVIAMDGDMLASFLAERLGGTDEEALLPGGFVEWLRRGPRAG